jgi:uncharacterized protein YbjT (DUF2867 family)
MAILVTGSTGTIGSQVLTHLEGGGVEVGALTRSPEKAKFPAGVAAVKGDLSDLGSLRSALASARFFCWPRTRRTGSRRGAWVKG